MLFKGVLIGLELPDFDRMCAMGLVFPVDKKVVTSESMCTNYWLTACSLVQACPGKNVVR